LSFQIDPQEGKALVQLARNAVEEYLKTRKQIKVPESIPEKFLQPCGVFVTINTIRNGEKELRGCIGYPYPITPLVEAIIDSAINSATQDPRFSPISIRELDNVVFEVSILTPPEKIETKKSSEYPAKIKVGEDGLIVERGMFKGLLLPQVPVEWEWDEEEFLCQCCIKAGLPPDHWLIDGTRIYKFSCIIAEETSPRGTVKVVDMRKGEFKKLEKKKHKE
jgi:uncharacterized protein (TIGR00296 family)